MNRRGIVTGLVLVAALVAAGTEAIAQPLGTFRWRYAPYCNVVTLSVVQQGPVFVVSGFDDNCGAGNASSVTGTAFLNPNGGIGIGLTTVAPSGASATSSIEVSPATLSGSWSDSEGNSGSFTFGPQLPAPGAMRPSASGPSGLTEIRAGTAVTLQPRRCYAIFAYGVGSLSDAGRLVTGYLRDASGHAIVNNAFVMVPGTVNLTSQGGTLGYVVGCNLSSLPQQLPAGWQLVSKAFTLP